jgi:hypothetical protein
MKLHSLPLRRTMAWFSLLCGTLAIQAFYPALETRLVLEGLASYSGYGRHVAISGDRVVVGAAGAIVHGERSGAAYVFVQENGVWIKEAELTPINPTLNSQFGYAVAISGEIIVVGAYGDTQYGNYAGAAYVFVRNENGWTQQAKLTPNDAHSWLQFGDPVAIDGERLVVGAIADKALANYSGAAYVFLRQGDCWIQEAKLKAALPRANAYFGFSLAIEGEKIGIGAPFSSLGASPYVGNACVFERTGQDWIQTAELWPEDPGSYQFFGWSVALNANSLIVGAPSASGSVSSSGVVYLFDQVGPIWSQTVRLEADDAATGDWFGASVAMQDDTLVVGSSQDSTFGFRGGSVYLFSRRVTGVDQTLELSGQDAAAGDQFGYGIAFNGLTLVVGAPDKTVNGDSGAGAAYLFTALPANEPPVADASATIDRVISSGNGGAWVTLDGSKSTDPDDDPLGFDWYLDEDRLAQGAVVMVHFGIGSHSITLRVSDGDLAAHDTITVEVVSPGNAIESVADQLHHSAIPKGQATALHTMLQSALKALDRGRPSQAIQHVRVFQKQLSALTGHRIDPDTAQWLDHQAQAIIDALSQNP